MMPAPVGKARRASCACRAGAGSVANLPDKAEICGCNGVCKGDIVRAITTKKLFTLDDHAKATEGVECRKDKEVIDESPAAYKPIEAVMAAQADLVDIVHTLKQVLCVKG